MGKAERYMPYFAVVLSAGLYIFIGYFLERHETGPLFLAYFLLFACYFYFIFKAQNSITSFILIGIALRLLLILSFPTLSDDIYRFVWDGKLLQYGINPFAQLPSAYVAAGNLPDGLTFELYQQLNSPDYFTIYPPFAQAVFWLSVVLSPSSVLGSAVVMHMLIILAEIGTIFYLLKLADHFKVERKNVLWYVLNPLVILELTGSLHFEAFMIFFLMAGIYYLLKNKLVIAAVLVALAISVKLLPLLLLPLFIRRLDLQRLMKFYGWTALFTIMAFLPLLSNALIEGMGNSMVLYFQKFEFNASIYYIIRAIGFQVRGYNVIGTAGPYLALSVFVLVTGFALYFKKMRLPQAALWIFMIYFLLATTVHPWYIATALAFSVLTNYRFVVLWSLLIFLTYAGYTATGFNEILWLTLIEYSLLFAYMFYEIFKVNKEKSHMASA